MYCFFQILFLISWLTPKWVTNINSHCHVLSLGTPRVTQRVKKKWGSVYQISVSRIWARICVSRICVSHNHNVFQMNRTNINSHCHVISLGTPRVTQRVKKKWGSVYQISVSRIWARIRSAIEWRNWWRVATMEYDHLRAISPAGVVTQIMA